MATNDTDPQRTEPGPPDVDDAGPEADAAASLLANLQSSSLPTDDVKETEGHVAASYAVAPHRPPRANDKTIENPAVLINATVPLPPPPSSARVKLGPPAPSVVSMNGAPTVVGAPSLFAPTDPAERARNQTRLVLACIGGVAVAALIAIVVLAVMPARSASSSTSIVEPSAAPPPSASAIATSSPSAIATTEQPSPSVTAPPTTTTTTTPATAKPHGRPHATSVGSSPTPRHSGNFAEPDRHL